MCFVDVGNALWLRGTDTNVENLWVWEHSGQPVGYDGWADSQQDDGSSDGEDCMQQRPANMVTIEGWNDLPCTEISGYPICEY